MSFFNHSHKEKSDPVHSMFDQFIRCSNANACLATPLFSG